MRVNSISVWMVAICLLCVGVVRAQVRAGTMLGGEVIVAEDAIPSEKYAAEEFKALVALMNNSGEAKAAKIYIGIEAVRKVDPKFEIADLGEEGLRIRVTRDAILIAGGQPRGTLYGVYEFFEKHLGYRFLTHDHTHVPSDVVTREIALGEHAFVPPFYFRWSFYNENATYPDFAARVRCNTTTRDEKLGGVTPQDLINHTFMRYINPEKYGKDHPEYFALVDGERKLTGTGGGPEPCVSNPEVIEIIANGVIADLDANPKMRNISVSQNDNDAYCRCEKCEEINQREGTPMGSNLALVNAVAERVARKHPEVKIGTLAYWYTRKAPKTIRPHKNIQIQLCSIEACTFHALNDPKCQRNREFAADLEEWEKICDDIWIWNYNTNFAAYDMPFPNLRGIGSTVEWFSKNNVRGVFMQANGSCLSGEFSDLRNYVISRCLWNPGEDSWKLTEEFCRLHYGKASDAILTHLKLIHDNSEATGVHPDCFPTNAELGLTADVAQKSFELFAEAMKVADDEVVRERVEKASITAYKALLATATQLHYEDRKVWFRLPHKTDEIADRYIELCRKHKLTHVGETRAAEEYFAELKKFGAGVPAEPLENDVWKIVVLPTENGKLSEMIHKPTGRDIAASTGRMTSRHHAHEEWGVVGYDHLKPVEFEARRDGQAVVMTKKLPDGETLERRIAFDPNRPEIVQFRTTLKNESAASKDYEFMVHPEYDPGTSDGEPDRFAVYSKDDAGWFVCNRDWNMDRGPDIDRLMSARGGVYGFFNHAAQFGVMQTYDPAKFSTQKLWWKPLRRQINLELKTNRVKLEPGERFEFGYDVEFITKPPL